MRAAMPVAAASFDYSSASGSALMKDGSRQQRDSLTRGRAGDRAGRVPSTRARALALAAATIASLAVGAVLRAQTVANGPLEGRWPLAAGNWWVLGSPSGERLELRASEERTSREGARVVRVDDSNGDYRLLSLGRDGSVELFELHRLGHAPMTFEPPLSLLPADARPGASHGHETALRSFDPSGDSEPQPGKARVRIEIGRPEVLRTPAGQFASCLAVETSLSLAWSDGTAHEETWRVWLAPGVGPVRWIAGAGSRGAPDLRLLEASVGDKPIPAER